MAKTTKKASTPAQPPALSPEARESQMIGYAVDLAERQLLEGTATSQVITHYLKMANPKEQIEREILRAQEEHIRAKTKAIHDAQRSDELFEEAMLAMARYNGKENVT